MNRRHGIAWLIVAATLLPGLTGCVRNPATGGTAFTGGMSASREARMGREYHPKVIEEFGGKYGDKKLQSYVDGIGQLLARTVERKDFRYTFTVLNSKVVNAFATPGGYIYITRGLLALADNEAQLAAVLAHELGHITALHHAKRYGQGLLANILMTGAALTLGRSAGGLLQAGQVGVAGLLSSFSREHEFQSDELGVRYLARVGYDPNAMAGFLRKLRANSQLSARLRGDSPDKVDKFNYLATHPAPVERVRRAARLAAAKRVAKPMTAQRVYYTRIDGILYGDDPDQGFIRGQKFAHPRMRFQFSVPKGFRLLNSSKAVMALGPKNSRIVFDRAKKPGTGSMKSYLTAVWAKSRRLADVETLRINGMEAATGTTSVRIENTNFHLRLLAIRFDRNAVYRFMFATPPALIKKLSVGLRRTTFSFRRLTVAEAARLKPNKLRIFRVGKGDSVKRLAGMMAFSNFREARFRVLNGLAPRERLKRNRLVKIVRE